MSHAAPECFAYPSHITFFGNCITELPIIPSDWVLNITNIASEWVEQQFLVHIADRPLVEPPAELDAVTLLSSSQLALRMADAYKHPDGDHYRSNFRPAESPDIMPGCINIAPCWFQQGHECYGPPPENPDDGFKPEISATLKGD
ncbi:hypothetical protein P692DRAFT_20877798 [Suillus brevipes Sb2]|nr:hypothetical protein P692DRAFT_20877798 [Suillus brevipes Sb2]